MKYCSYCKTLHTEHDLCENIKNELKNDPNLLVGAANFANIAGQYHLITSQTLENIIVPINKLMGTNLNYEGTHQMVRDIQVFHQMNIDAFSRMRPFDNVQKAQKYIQNASPDQLKNLTRKLNGTAQEVDWLRAQKGNIKRIFQKSKLLGEELSNTPGVDGEIINRFNGKTIVKTTVKAAQDSDNLGTNINGVLKSLKKGTLQPDDILVGIEGTEEALKKALKKNIEAALKAGDMEYAEKLRKALEKMKVKEMNTTSSIKDSTSRLKDKMMNGKAYSEMTLEQVQQKALQGAVIGATLGLTISSITNYIRYKKCELSEQDALAFVGRDTVKGLLSGAAMSTVTLFLPTGALGMLGGMAIGMYINTTLTNVLDEIFGKGVYEQILHSAGYIAGMAKSLESAISEIQQHERAIAINIRKIQMHKKAIQNNFATFDDLMRE